MTEEISRRSVLRSMFAAPVIIAAPQLMRVRTPSVVMPRHWFSQIIDNLQGTPRPVGGYVAPEEFINQIRPAFWFPQAADHLVRSQVRPSANMIVRKLADRLCDSVCQQIAHQTRTLDELRRAGLDR